MDLRKNSIDKTEKKLKSIISKSIINGDYSKAVDGIYACSRLLYICNKKLIDDDLEDSLKVIGSKLISPNFKHDDTNKETVIFYDGVGFDTRGLSLIYLKALAESGYKIVWITPNDARGKQPETDRILTGYNVVKIYYQSNNNLTAVNTVIDILEEYRPRNMIIWALEYDVVWGCALSKYSGIINRIKINQGDHVYSLGTTVCDCLLDFRDWGASLSKEYRHVPENKIVKLPYYPYYDNEEEFKGLPFDEKNKKIIFSGGSLYKTIGDTEKTYYKIVKYLLNNDKGTVFLYAGNGNNPKELEPLEEICSLYPNRAFHIKERKDLFQVLQHCTIYLNTYPLLGGLMTQYAAIAGKIPLTLVPSFFSDGSKEFLLKEDERKIFYSNWNDLAKDALLLLNDDIYRKAREKLLEGAVISEIEFRQELSNVLNNNTTKYSINFKHQDIDGFLSTYINRLSLPNDIDYAVASRVSISLLKDFPNAFFRKIVNKIIKTIRKE